MAATLLAENLGFKQKFDGAKVHPFWEERLKAERKFDLAIYKGFQKIFENLQKKFRKEGNKSFWETKQLEDIPSDQIWWTTQQGEFFSVVGALLVELLQQGVDQASRLGLAVDFELMNEAVFILAGQFQNEWWNRLEARTRNSLRIAIQNHIATGESLPELIQSISPLFGRSRAKIIAATEVTRLFAEGNRAVYRQLGLDDEWRTVQDFRVDPICIALSGKTRIGDGRTEYPPAHISCRCWIAPIVEGRALTNAAA